MPSQRPIKLTAKRALKLERRSNETYQSRKALGQRTLVLQGSGALGACQAGVYLGLSEAGIEPDWIAGTSIGAINAALIAGNEPVDRLERLQRFLGPRVSSLAMGNSVAFHLAQRFCEPRCLEARSVGSSMAREGESNEGAP